jgi:hypothetical protein
MSRKVACRRTQRRFSISQTASAFVELEYPPSSGNRLKLPLVDISVSGLSFRFTDELAGIDSGTSLGPVKIHVGNCEMSGEFLIMHVTPESAFRTICGALFYPTSDDDLIKLKSVVAGIETAGTAVR